MTPTRRGDWRPPRDRKEVLIAVLASLAVIVATATLVWFLRPNRDSGSTIPSLDVTPTTVSTPTPSTTAAPVSTSTP